MANSHHLNEPKNDGNLAMANAARGLAQTNQLQTNRWPCSTGCWSCSSVFSSVPVRKKASHYPQSLFQVPGKGIPLSTSIGSASFSIANLVLPSPSLRLPEDFSAAACPSCFSVEGRVSVGLEGRLHFDIGDLDLSNGASIGFESLEAFWEGSDDPSGTSLEVTPSEPFKCTRALNGCQ